MANYINYNPLTLFDKALFNFQGGNQFRYSGTIKVSLSDGFPYYYFANGYVYSDKLTMFPYNGEVIWNSNDKKDVDDVLTILSSFANLNFSSTVEYDTVTYNGITYQIVTPFDVGVQSDINITLMFTESNHLGQSGGSNDYYGYLHGRGDIFINMNGAAFFGEGGVTF